MKLHGHLRSATPYRQIVKTPIITINETLEIRLLHNDVAVTVFYKNGNHPWRSVLINAAYVDEAIPRYSDVYLCCALDNSEQVCYDIQY